jgi:hypothetical protein
MVAKKNAFTKDNRLWNELLFVEICVMTTRGRTRTADELPHAGEELSKSTASDGHSDHNVGLQTMFHG